MREVRDIICIYHNADLDGKCSAAIAYEYLIRHQWLPGERPHKVPHLNNNDMRFLGHDYGQASPDLSAVGEKSVVIMLDVALPTEEMERIADTAQKFIWIDHHETSMERLAHLIIPGFRSKEYAACELTWKYFNSGSMPRAIELIGRYDLWDHSNPDTVPFQHALRSLDTGLFDEAGMIRDPWTFITKDETDINQIIQDGLVIQRAKKRDNERTMERAFEVDFDGLHCLAVNSAGNSKIFEDRKNFRKEKYDGYIAFSTNGLEERVSLYKADYDVNLAQYAVKYGGGGHRSACGFVCKHLVFSRFEDKIIMEVKRKEDESN